MATGQLVGLKVLRAEHINLGVVELLGTKEAKTLTEVQKVEIGVHLHSRPEHAEEKILAAYDAGCRRFDSDIAGLGGCPFAQDDLVGNIPTERVLRALASRGIDAPIRKPLDSLIHMSAEIGEQYKV